MQFAIPRTAVIATALLAATSLSLAGCNKKPADTTTTTDSTAAATTPPATDSTTTTTAPADSTMTTNPSTGAFTCASKGPLP